MLEKVIEAHLVKRVKEQGGIAYKFTSPQRRSVPDRLVLKSVDAAVTRLRQLLLGHGIPERRINLLDLRKEAEFIVESMVHFVETKATGCKPTPMQQREHERLRALGFTVYVIDNKEEIDERYLK